MLQLWQDRPFGPKFHSAQRRKGAGKGEGGGKGDGKRGLHYLGGPGDGGDDDDEGIKLGCLIVDAPLNVMRQEAADELED